MKLLRELEAWLVWKLDGLSMADQDRRRGVLPWFILGGVKR